ncbi:MAG: PorT family protein [Flavobacteriales bacterium]|jgi:hypothetical protein|nr:PorT family protein [Flavobacteriales bacterium]
MKITRLAATALIVALSTFSLLAQSDKITFGVRAGLNYSNIIVKDGDLTVPLGQFAPVLDGKEVKGKGGFNFDPKPSFYIGVTADFPVKKWFHIQGELLYVENYGQGGMGATFEQSAIFPAFPTSGERPEDLRLSYIQLPVLAKFYVMKNLPLMVGPYVGVGVSYKGIPTAEENPHAKDISHMYKRMDFGAMAAAAYEFKFGLFVEARYVFGMMNTLKDDFEMNDLGITSGAGKVNVDLKANTENISGQNNSFQIGVGFRF